MVSGSLLHYMLAASYVVVTLHSLLTFPLFSLCMELPLGVQSSLLLSMTGGRALVIIPQ